MIVLDTHAWIWWASDPARLGRRGRSAIEAADRIGIPAVSCFEVAAAVARGRMSLDRSPLEWLEEALGQPRVELLPLTPPIAVRATQLGGFHGDPADRLDRGHRARERGGPRQQGREHPALRPAHDYLVGRTAFQNSNDTKAWTPANLVSPPSSPSKAPRL